jgi:sugar/nucleoside kinase (ribokinase family)
MPQVVVLSDGLIEYWPDAEGVPQQHGVSGDGVAMAIAVSHLNHHVAELTGGDVVQIKMPTATGDDDAGVTIRNFCDQHHIDTSWFVLMPGGKTAGWVFTVDPHPLKKARLYLNRDTENCPID